jgi:hypothetical protein
LSISEGVNLKPTSKEESKVLKKSKVLIQPNAFSIFLSRQFICSNSPDDDIQTLYKILEDEDNFEDLYDYFYQIDYILEQGDEFFYFSRNEKNADLERKIEKAFGWINTLDFFKTFDSSFEVNLIKIIV